MSAAVLSAVLPCSLGLGVVGVLAAILWGVWYFGPKPRGSFWSFVATAFGARMYDLPTTADPFAGRDDHAEPLIPDHEPRKPTSTGERKARGLRARIQREEIENALDRMALKAAKAWSESTPGETAKREEAYRLVNVIRALREELRSVEADGNMAAAEEQAEQRRKAARPADNRD